MENEGPTVSENQKKRGCYVSLVRGTVIAVLGFIVLLLVILIAYFAGEKVVTYACDDKTTSIPSSKDDNLTNTCARLAATGNVQICKLHALFFSFYIKIFMLAVDVLFVIITQYDCCYTPGTTKGHVVMHFAKIQCFQHFQFIHTHPDYPHTKISICRDIE